MAKLYRKTDRIKIKIGKDDGIVLTVSPLSQHEKMEVQQGLIKSKLESNPLDATKAIMLAMKYSIKSVDGLIDAEGNPCRLVMENGVLSDDSLEDLLNMDLTGEVMIICSALSSGVPKSFVNPVTNTPLVDVEIIGVEPEKKLNPT